MDAEEAILGALSPEEIACLVDQLEEIDPENELLPAGMSVLFISNKLFIIFLNFVNRI